MCILQILFYTSLVLPISSMPKCFLKTAQCQEIQINAL